MRMSEVVLEERGCDAMKVLESDGLPKPHSPAHAHEHNATHTQHQEHSHNECVKEQSCSDLSNQTQVSERSTYTKRCLSVYHHIKGPKGSCCSFFSL